MTRQEEMPLWTYALHHLTRTLTEKYFIFSDDVQLGCKELRAKRFISDGFCTSLKAIKEVVCAGQCMPIKEQNLPWWAEFTKYWAKPKFKEWRCVDAVTKLKKVQLMCRNGETRTYKIKIVKSCRCKSYEREPNRTERRTAKPVIDVEKERKRLEKLERQERKRLKREKRLEREREKRAKRQLRKSSRESRKHRHSGDRDRRHERRRHKNNNKSPAEVDTVSDTRHRISQTFTNNDSPTV